MNGIIALGPPLMMYHQVIVYYIFEHVKILNHSTFVANKERRVSIIYKSHHKWKTKVVPVRLTQ